MHLHRLPPPWQRPLAAALAVLVLGVALLSSAPGLHEQMHPDAHAPEHHCAITLFTDGLLPALAGAVPTMVLAVLCTFLRPDSIEALGCAAVVLPPVRGPPRV